MLTAQLQVDAPQNLQLIYPFSTNRVEFLISFGAIWPKINWLGTGKVGSQLEPKLFFFSSANYDGINGLVISLETKWSAATGNATEKKIRQICAVKTKARRETVRSAILHFSYYFWLPLCVVQRHLLMTHAWLQWFRSKLVEMWDGLQRILYSFPVGGKRVIMD